MKKLLLITAVIIMIATTAVYFTRQNVVEPINQELQFVYDGNTPVYVTFYSHNEDSWASIVMTETKYADYRAGLVDRADLFAKYDIPWDWQTDLPVVEAMLEYESEEGENILQYLEASGASLDPHAHTNNYADISYVMELLGAHPSSVIGGLAYIGCGNEYLGLFKLLSWHEAIDLQPDGFVYGEKYPDAKWQPLVLSDPGMGGHFFDDFTSGVWKPGDEENFYTHYPDNDIIYIGEGYPHYTELVSEEHASGSEVLVSDGEYIKELVAKIENGELPTGLTDGTRFMYTASIHVRDTAIVSEGTGTVVTLEGMQSIIDALMPLSESGEIIFVDFEEAARIWQTEYESVYWQTSLESFSFYKEALVVAEGKCLRTTDVK